MRRGRKQRVVWLPADLSNRLGVAPAVATIGQQSASFIFTLTGPPLGDPESTVEIPLVKDFVNAGTGGVPQLTDLTLADLKSSGYRLKRIVGKIFVLAFQDTGALAPSPSIFKVTIGMMVRRVDQGGVSLAGLTSSQESISTGNMDNFSDPWIWRRSWVLSNNSAAGIAIDPNGGVIPGCNVQGYGSSAQEGSHVDAKTARTVGAEERLFLDATCEGMNGQAQADPGAILIVGDLRILGSMVSQTGNRNNSTR